MPPAAGNLDQTFMFNDLEWNTTELMTSGSIIDLAGGC